MRGRDLSGWAAAADERVPSGGHPSRMAAAAATASGGGSGGGALRTITQSNALSRLLLPLFPGRSATAAKPGGPPNYLPHPTVSLSSRQLLADRTDHPYYYRSLLEKREKERTAGPLLGEIYGLDVLRCRRLLKSCPTFVLLLFFAINTRAGRI